MGQVNHGGIGEMPKTETAMPEVGTIFAQKKESVETPNEEVQEEVDSQKEETENVLAKFCSNCGTKVTGNFCSNCGAKIG